MPSRSDHIIVSGFNQALIVSQRAQRYDPDVDCTMTLSVRGGSHAIQLLFEHMDMPARTYSTCDDDYVQFFSGTSPNEVPISRQYCGNVRPTDNVIMNSTSVRIRFRTNNYKQRTGFRIKLDRVSHNELVHCDERNVCRTELEGVLLSKSNADSSGKISTSSGMCIYWLF